MIRFYTFAHSLSHITYYRVISLQNNEVRGSIVHWPSPPIKHRHERARSVPPSLKTRNITDPDRIDEYRRQKELELQAMRRREKEAIAWEEKQVINIKKDLNLEFHDLNILFFAYEVY